MEVSADSINRNYSILISRNRPLSLVVGVAGFIGSHLAEELINKGIQVIGIDDFSSGNKKYLNNLVKSKDFHLINDSIESHSFFENNLKNLSIPRLDYAFFCADDNKGSTDLYTHGLHNFLEFIKITRDKLKPEKSSKYDDDKNVSEKPRIVLLSSAELYNQKVDSKLKKLKEAEIKFAKYIKYYKLNARVIRLATIYGPRMNFLQKDPIVRLIKSAVKGDVQKEPVSTDFSTRAVFIDDAVHLIIKSVLSGSTSHKIYDCALNDPIKISEIKQILLDPVWHEMKHFHPSELPPWPTPNLVKTEKELSWKPKTDIIQALKHTISYFEHNGLPDIDEEDHEEKEEIAPDPKEPEPQYQHAKKWSFASMKEDKPDDEQGDEADDEKDEKPSKKGFLNTRRVGLFLVLAIIIYGLVTPIVELSLGAFNIRNRLKSSREAIIQGDFAKAQQEIRYASLSVDEGMQFLKSLTVLKRIGVFDDQLNKIEQLVYLVDEGLSGVEYGISGTQTLFDTTKIISGESNNDPRPYYAKANTELSTASDKLSKVKSRLSDPAFLGQYPDILTDQTKDLSSKLDTYSRLIDKAKSASFLLPQITAIDGKKEYLVLLQNNLELRPGGGFIGSYGKLSFQNGKLVNITVDDIYNLDGGLKDVIAPPADIKNDIGINRWYLRDSNYDPDFPSSARQAEFFFKREEGTQVHGVFTLDLTAAGKLLNAIGGLDLPDYDEKVTGDNLFERAITHAEVNFFPGSQAKKNYLTSLQTNLLNKMFYLQHKNWPAIIQAVGDSLTQKHMMVYLAEPNLLSYVVSEDWAGVMPRGVANKEGESNDFLAVVESNMGVNKANYYLSRSFKLSTKIGKEGQISHNLKINYKNDSPSDVFPAGKYKNRFRIYLPLGTKLNKVQLGEVDLTNQTTSFSDYGRTGFSVLVTINPKEQKQLILEYTLKDPLSFVDKKSKYRLDVIKQAGTDKDTFDWNLTYPIHLDIENSKDKTKQELNITTDLLTNRSFSANFLEK